MKSKEIKGLLEEHSNELRNIPKDKIIKALINNGINATKELVDFEHNFGGLKLIIENHEFQFGLLWGGGFPFDPELASVENGVDDLYTEKKSEIYCSSNSCFDNFIIDEYGSIFLDEEKLYENFEDLLLDHIHNKYYEISIIDQNLPPKSY